MRKKAFVAALLAVVMLAVPSVADPLKQTVSAQSGTQIWVSGVPLKLSAPVITLNKTTVVPLREVAEALGAKVAWKMDSKQRQTITLTRGNRSAALTLGSNVLMANGRIIKLDVAPLIKGKVTLVPLRAISESLGTVVAWDGINKIVHIDEPAELPIIGTKQKLEQLLKQIEKNTSIYYRGSTGFAETADGTVISKVAENSLSAAASESPASASGDYSQTNVQVEGVDEADWAKTDGSFIYQLSGSRILISDISNSSAPKLAATLEYSPKEGFYPQELYVDDNQLIVIGQNNTVIPMPIEPGIGGSDPAGEGSSSNKMGIMPPRPVSSTVQTKVYDMSASGQPKLARETELEGSYISSRKIDSSLYVITNKYNNNDFEPMYGDSAVSKDLKRLPLSDIRYFPESPENSTLLIGAVDLAKPAQEMQVTAYLGSGQTIYASSKHLYVAIAKYLPSGDTYRQETQVYKFRLDQGNIVYIGEGSVPGSILNQFSMDEYEGYFRIATTKGDMWASGAERSTNNLYVLDEQLKTVGTLENLAPGERIYSTRFMGSRAYMVTFRNVDPLFAIALSNPVKPAVLGQLKIPGYSDYLHPYDENHIIGFGKETVELPSKGMGQDEMMAFYQGMKIALFDVSDVSQPKEKFKEIIGDRGTQSELLYNHKALLFSKSKGLMAFPVELMEIKDKNPIEQGGFPAYGQFTYQGAFIYHIDLEKGFDLRGRITHLSENDLSKSGQYGFDYGKSIRRILYAGNTLYTLSERMLKANNMSSLKENGSLTYPAPPKH
ncbi:beta-propeller domain-containing protein [Cohnella sp.]|uniref:beta-propeller domain-containing protein n=1 Tax=Cohnella sp. TaxID=1883426 RepID=UPI00356A7639